MATPTPFADRSDVELGMRSMLGRTAGVGVVGVLGVVRYTMPVPVRGLSLDALLFMLEGTVALADELRVTAVGFTGDREGKETPSCGGALVAAGIGTGTGMGRADDGGCRREGMRRRSGVPGDPALEERDARENEASLVGVRRLPWVCGRRRGRGTDMLRIEGDGDG